jgi:hypothetical protein
MVYSAEVMLPVDISFRSPRVKNFNEDRSDEYENLR